MFDETNLCVGGQLGDAEQDPVCTARWPGQIINVERDDNGGLTAMIKTGAVEVAFDFRMEMIKTQALRFRHAIFMGLRMRAAIAATPREKEE